MNKKAHFIHLFSIGASILLFVTAIAVTGVQMYIRWYINQTYLMVGGIQLEVLTISSVALILTLALVHRPK